jgi:hypothetical protein
MDKKQSRSLLMSTVSTRLSEKGLQLLGQGFPALEMDMEIPKPGVKAAVIQAVE